MATSEREDEKEGDEQLNFRQAMIQDENSSGAPSQEAND